MAAMSVTGPPQEEQVVMSIWNTRLSNCAQLRRARVEEEGGSPSASVRADSWVGRAGGNLSPEGRVRRQHAMKPNEMEPWPWDEGREALQKFQRCHHEMGGAIAVWGFWAKARPHRLVYGVTVCGPGPGA